MLWSGLEVVGLGRARSNWLMLLRCPCHELAKLNNNKKNIISLYFARKTPKSPKSHVQVQNGPIDLILPVYEKEKDCCTALLHHVQQILRSLRNPLN